MRGCLRKAKNQKRGLKKGEWSWDIILPLGRGADGKHKQKWKRFNGTKKQAEQKLTELIGEVQRGEFIEPSKMTLGEWLDVWMEKAIKPPRCAVNTYRSYLGAIRTHIKPTLGQIPLQQLTSLQIERYYADVKLAPASVAVHHIILTSSLKAAMNAGLLRQNVATRTTNKPRVNVGEDLLNNVWTADEARRFLATVKQSGSAQSAALFALAIDSGARKGELLGLKWSDLEGATLRIERQIIRPDKDNDTDVPVFALPKSKRARSLDLSEDTLALLKTHKAQQAELKLANRQFYQDHGLMFAHAWEHQCGHGARFGDPLNVSTINAQLKRFCKDANVKLITPHGLRHTCATLLLSAGVPAHVVQRRLGHKTVEITLNLYAHVLPNMQADAASKLATLVHG